MYQNMLYYAEFFKYALNLKICIYMQNKLFSIDSLLHKSFTFLTPVELHTLITNMLMHKNPDPNNNKSILVHLIDT